MKILKQLQQSAVIGEDLSASAVEIRFGVVAKSRNAKADSGWLGDIALGSCREWSNTEDCKKKKRRSFEETFSSFSGPENRISWRKLHESWGCSLEIKATSVSLEITQGTYKFLEVLQTWRQILSLWKLVKLIKTLCSWPSLKQLCVVFWQTNKGYVCIQFYSPKSIACVLELKQTSSLQCIRKPSLFLHQCLLAAFLGTSWCRAVE